MISDEKIALLKDYFAKKQDIVMAFISRTYAKSREMSESDLDIAIYFQPTNSMLEWEETKQYENEDIIWNEIERTAGIKTDLIVLNRAPATLAAAIISEGVPIVIKDYALYLRFLLTVSSAAEYFREFTIDFWNIKQRSRSLTDIDRDRLIRIADCLETELKEYPAFISLNQKIYESDGAPRGNPETYREILRELSLINDFDQEAAEKLAQFAKLRNILAHEYLDIRFVQIKKFIQESEPAYRQLLDFFKKFVA